MKRVSNRLLKSGFSQIQFKGILVGLLVVFSPSSFAGKILVGSDGGSISVGNSGGAAWSMPVEVPSGINGVAPNITLSVSSNGGNGSLGIGGGLSGLSSITRCGRSLNTDGYFQASQYTINDAYCLDGARLLLESGSYGAAGSIYRTEVESFRRIKALGSDNGKGPTHFEVTNRAGAKSYYGASEPRKTFAGDPATGVISAWKVSHLRDSNSNELAYFYKQHADNEVLLDRITYGGNSAKGVSASLSVRLVYEDREDKATAWSRGAQYSQTKRIKNIQTYVVNSLVKDYRITYAQGLVSKASRIASVQECAGNGDCYRPSTFEYAPEQETAWSSSAAITMPSAALQTSDGKPLGTIIDINNDGKSDWVRASTDSSGASTLTTYLGSLNGWQQSASFTLPDALFDYSQNADGFAKGLLLDINSDGWPDYVQAYQTPTGNSLQTWRNTGAGFTRDASLDLIVPLSALGADGKVQSLAELVDLNADGLVDIMQSIKTADGVMQQTWMHRESSGTHSWVLDNAYTAKTIGIDYTQGAEGRILATLQDVNGDGLSDWVQSYTINSSTSNATWLNTGRGWQASTQFQLPNSTALFDYDLNAKGVAKYTFADLNGDGLPDLVKALWINGGRVFDSWIHTGVAWAQDSAYNLPLPLTIVDDNGNAATVGGLVDLNSDGHPDFARSYSSENATSESSWLFNPTTKRWSSTDKYRFPLVNNQVKADGTSFSTVEMVDLNHDGYPEMFSTVTGAVYTAKSVGSANYPGTLVGTKNSLGAITNISYGITTDPDIYQTAELTPYPNVAYNAPIRVVKEVSVSNGIGGMVSAIHSYGKAKTNLRGLGGLGYQYHAIKDGSSGVQVLTTFHQTYPYAGRIKGSSKYLNNTSFSVSSSEIVLSNMK